ncbi:MAG: hypothetical protein ABFC24_08605 [Methanoregulaceae archaeon]
MAMNEYLRKIAHLIVGLGIAGIIWFLPKAITIPGIAISLLVGLGLIDLSLKKYYLPGISELLALLEREGGFPGKGAFFFVFSALLVVILFPAPVASLAVAVLAVLDSVSAICGRRFGNHRIRNGKSFEGFFAGFLVTAIVLAAFVSPGSAIVLALFAGIVELVSPVDDNLVLPVLVALPLYFIL